MVIQRIFNTIHKYYQIIKIFECFQFPQVNYAPCSDPDIYRSQNLSPFIIDCTPLILVVQNLGHYLLLFSEEYNSDFRKFAQKRPLFVIIFLSVSVLPNIFPARLAKPVKCKIIYCLTKLLKS